MYFSGYFAFLSLCLLRESDHLFETVSFVFRSQKDMSLYMLLKFSNPLIQIGTRVQRFENPVGERTNMRWT